MSAYVGYQMSQIGRSGKYCWNSEIGCGSQIQGLRFVIGVLLKILIFGFIVNKISK